MDDNLYFPQYYVCGEKRFTNIYKAFDYQRTSGHFPRYEIDPELIESLKNIKRPNNLSPQLIQTLIVKGLKKLRAGKRKLRLLLGGGTDSWTILRLCVENDIYLDEVVTALISPFGYIRSDLEYLPAVKYAEKFVNKSIGKLVLIRPTLEDLDFLDDPLWYKKITGPRVPYKPYLPEIYRKQLDDKSFINITGQEKPSFLKENGQIYLSHVDGGFGEFMGIDTVPLLFDKNNLELHVAMAYILLDTLPSKIFKNSYTVVRADTLGYLDKKLSTTIAEKLGLATPKPWLNFHYLGKKPHDQNLKTKYFYKELEKTQKNDFPARFQKSMEHIYEQYKDLPHAMDKEGKIIKPTGRFSQKIPILQDRFGV